MTQFLVSVRDSQEAQLAIDASVELIDVKAPERGSLGRADHQTLCEIATHVNATKVTLSAALGELVEWNDDFDFESLRGFQYAKLGLAQSRQHADWRNGWDTIIKRIPAGVGAIAVAYVDMNQPTNPDPTEVIRAAVDFGCTGILFDTYDKSQGGIYGHVSRKQLGLLISAASQRELTTAIGGSLSLENLLPTLELGPDIVAVRGAVCRGGRNAGIDRELLDQWVEQFQEADHASANG